MKTLAPALLAAALLGAGAGARAAGALPLPQAVDRDTRATLDGLVQDALAMDRAFGRFPPDFATDAARRAAYERWSAVLAAARAVALEAPGRERTLYLMAELFRLGHHLGVTGAGHEAEAAVETCLERIPDSVPCHLSALRLYLAAGPDFAARAERSLALLADAYRARPDEAVARGRVLLALRQGRPEDARRAAGDFLEHFPEAADAPLMARVRAGDEVRLPHRGWQAPP